MNEITVIAASWGAVLSTCVFYIGNQISILSLNGANVSKRPISLSSYGLKIPNNRKLWFPNDSPYAFPTTLTDGQAVTIWREVRLIAEKLIEEGNIGDINIKGFFKDVTGKEYTTKNLNFNPENWIEGD